MDEVTKAINEGFEGLKPEIAETIDEKTAEKFVGITAEMKGIQGKLDELCNKGESASAEQVKDLEAKLAEAETKQADIEEQFRLIKVGGAMTPQTKKDPFKGILFKDQKELARALRDVAYDENTKSVSSTLFATAGRLPAEAVDGFWKSVIDQQVTLKAITNRAMMAGTGTTDELTVTARSMVAATEGSTVSDNAAVSARRRTITNVEVAWGCDITKTFLEDNIERENAEATIMGQIALQFGNDIADLGWNGDDDSSTTFLAINDGWLTLAGADTYVNDVTSYDSGATASDVLLEWRKSMPTKFRNIPDLTYFVPYNFAENYADEVASRATGLGDQVLINGLPALRYFGHRIIADPYLASTTGMYTPASNLYLAYRRAITVDATWVPRTRLVEITLTARNDYEYASGQAIVLGTNIPSDLTS